MKKLAISYVLVILVSCQQDSGIEIENLPIFSSNFDIGEDALVNKDSLIEISPYWTKKIKKQTESTDEIFGLVKFDIPTIDAEYERDIELYLVKSVSGRTNENYLISVDSTDGIVDGIRYDPKIMRLKAIYQHSSSLGHEGIAAEFVEDNSTPDSLKVFRYTFEIFENGLIKLISKSSDEDEIFKRLTQDCKICGQYSLVTDNSEVEIEIKDGTEEETIAFNVELTDDKGCLIVYQNLDSKFVENSIVLDSLIMFSVDETDIAVEIDFETDCGVVIKENRKLKKAENTH